MTGASANVDAVAWCRPTAVSLPVIRPMLILPILACGMPLVSDAADPGDAGEGRFAPVREINASDGKLQWTQFSPDGSEVAACGDRYIQSFDVETGKLVRRFRGHAEDISRFAYSPDGRLVASGSRDKTVRIWDAKSAEVLAVLDDHTDRIIGVNFSADSRYLASASSNNDGTIRVWDCEHWQQVAVAKAPPDTNAMYVAFSPDGRRLATSEYRGGVRLYRFDGKSLELQHAMSHDGGEMVPHVTFTPDGESFLTSSWDRTVRRWDVESGTQIWKRKTPPYARCFEAALFSPDGTLLFSVTRDETIQKRDGKTGKVLATRRWNDQVRGLAISPDASRLATAGHRGVIKLWSVDQFARR